MTERIDEKELAEIIAKFTPIISFRVKKTIGSRTPDWEDIVNEILTNLVEKVKSGGFRGESSIGTFIYTITQRRIIDYIRKKSKTLPFIPETNPFPPPNIQMENKQRARRLGQAIENLKKKYRNVLYLYYYKDLSRNEVAEQLGLTPSRVSERVNYAIKLLRDKLKD
ncbi:MAG: sigma-70 family RNA polymerase sigma factor [Candidatus Aminicenantes bacterium]|nr:sigma-70 family RNA polymerase sigma factor [Candidatus Aminicenantes bacterium]